MATTVIALPAPTADSCLPIKQYDQQIKTSPTFAAASCPKEAADLQPTPTQAGSSSLSQNNQAISPLADKTPIARPQARSSFPRGSAEARSGAAICPKETADLQPTPTEFKSSSLSENN